MRTKEELVLIREYCEAFRDWARLVHWKAAEFDGSTSNSGMHEAERWKKLAEALSIVELAIIKSCYLERRIYGGEAERIVKCPEHQGRWSGCVWGEQMCEHGCQFGANVTGWLQEPHDYLEAPPDESHVVYCHTRCFQCGGTKEAVVHSIDQYKKILEENNNMHM